MKTIDENGSIKLFRKSTLCWILNEKKRLSTDRLLRYKFSEGAPKKIKISDSAYDKKDHITSGDFVVLREQELYLLGEVLNFQYINETALRWKRFNRKYCSTKADNVGILGNWFIIKPDGNLMPIIINDYLEIDKYLFNVSHDQFNLDNLWISSNVTEFLFD